MLKKKLKGIVSLVLAASMMLSMTGCKIQYIDDEPNVDVTVSADKDATVQINVYYYDSTYEAYLAKCAEEYENANEGIDIVLYPVDESDYVDDLIKSAYGNGREKADLFLVENDSLEEIRLAGIAADNNMGDIYSRYNYSTKALSACTYNGKLIGYPLSFNTSFIVYNKNYVSEIPQTFEDIKNYADTMELLSDASIKSVFSYDLNDIFFNYGFLGGVLNIGGANGDDKSKNFEITGALQNAVEEYQQLIEAFSLDIDKVDYYTSINDFESGSTVFSVADTTILNKIIRDVVMDAETSESVPNAEEIEHEANIASGAEGAEETQGVADVNEGEQPDLEDDEYLGEYETAQVFDAGMYSDNAFFGVIPFPDLSADIPSSPLSTVTSVVVNPFSSNVEIAESFAKYVTYTAVGNLFEYSGRLSCRNIFGNDAIFSQIYTSFDKSTPKLKVMYNAEFYALLEVSMHLMAAGEDGLSALYAVSQYLGVEWQEGLSPSVTIDLDSDIQ